MFLAFLVVCTISYSNLLPSISEAVPKRILELMNVPGLTRENVASHLQVWISLLYVVVISGILFDLLV